MPNWFWFVPNYVCIMLCSLADTKYTKLHNIVVSLCSRTYVKLKTAQLFGSFYSSYKCPMYLHVTGFHWKKNGIACIFATAIVIAALVYQCLQPVRDYLIMWGTAKWPKLYSKNPTTVNVNSHTSSLTDSLGQNNVIVYNLSFVFFFLLFFSPI